MAEGDSRNAISTIPVNDNNLGIVVEGNDRGEVACTLTSGATLTRRGNIFSQESKKHVIHDQMQMYT